MWSNTIWLVSHERSSYSAINKRNFLGNGAIHTESHWNYNQGRCLNQSFTGITLLFLASLMPYLCLLFSTAIYYSSKGVTIYLGFPLEFDKRFSCLSHWRTREAAVERWSIHTHSLPYYKDKSYAFGGRCSIFRHAKWLTAILLEDTRMTEEIWLLSFSKFPQVLVSQQMFFFWS